MAKKDKEKAIAEGMFIEQGLKANVIAELLGVSEKTISGWRTSGEWDRRRDEAIAAPHKIRELLLQELKKLAQGGTTEIDADAISKLGKVMESLNDRLSPQVVMSVLQGFDNWMADNDPQTAVEFLKWHKMYLQHLISQYVD